MDVSSESARRSRAPGATPDRVFASHLGDLPGPTSIFIAGLHGNEPAGIDAIGRVFNELSRHRQHFAGRAFGLIGSVTATRQQLRFIDADLNRAFRYDLHEGLRLSCTLQPDDVEHRELHDLLDEVRVLMVRHDAAFEAYTIDLHTFSSDGPPFAVFSDTLRNRAFAECWPVPFILGLAEQIRGTATEYFTAAGFVSAVIETGRHDDPRSIDRHESAIRLALVQAGHVDAAAFPELPEDRARLARAARGVPRVLDVQTRHAVAADECFRMKPGFANFTPIIAGQHVADTAAEPVFAERSGRILLPLYQPQGDDGYFIARPISPVWLRISTVLRRLRVNRLARCLPGVRPHPRIPHAMLVDTRVARILTMEVFHLLGYRRVRREGADLLVSRRAHDLRPPPKIEF